MEQFEAVVIGGGIVGCATAWFLARDGVRVLLVERGGIAGGTSSSCMGHLMMLPDPEPMFRFTRRSIELWKQFHADVGGFDLLPCGCLWLAEDADDFELVADIHDRVQGYGDAGMLLDARELHRREPALAEDLVGAFFFPEDGVVFPMQAAGALLAAAVGRGAEVWTHTSVDAIATDAGGAVTGVATSRGPVSVSVVVNAAGVWSPDLTESAGLGRAPVFPRRGDLAITMPQHQPVKHQLLEVGYLRSATGKVADPEDEDPDPGGVALNVQPQGNGTILIGSTRQFAGMDRRPNPRLVAESLRRATRFVPELRDLSIVRTWAGLRPYTRDKLPIVGPVEGCPGFFMASGHEGLGITLSMATGEWLSAAIRGAPIPGGHSLAPFSLARFAEVPAR